MHSSEILEKITRYRIERGWSISQLAEKARLRQSTISSWYQKNQIPRLPSLMKICDAFNISLSQFFRDDNENYIRVNQDENEFLNGFNRLTEKQQYYLKSFIKESLKLIRN